MGQRSFESFAYLRKYNLHTLRKGGRKVFVCQDDKARRNVRMAASNASKDGKRYSTHRDGDTVIVLRFE